VNNDKTLYVSDLDGTLLNPSAELSVYTKQALGKLIAGGLHFTAATARTAASALKILDGLTLNIPVILMNGVLIYDIGQKQYLQLHKLAPEAVQAVIGVIRSLDMTGFMYQLKDDALTTYYESLDKEPLRAFVEERVTRYYKTFGQVGQFSDIDPNHIIYFTLLDQQERIRSVYDAFHTLSGLNLTMYKDTYSPDLWYLEVFHADASKQNAVTYLRERYGFTRVVGFGDNLNDLPLFAACDVRVAVENARAEVRAAADYVCGASDADGVVKWIEAFGKT